jgi:hypothetical protein
VYHDVTTSGCRGKLLARISYRRGAALEQTYSVSSVASRTTARSHVGHTCYFLETGKQKETLHWIRTDAVPRETVWEGRAGREAWEKGQP